MVALPDIVTFDINKARKPVAIIGGFEIYADTKEQLISRVRDYLQEQLALLTSLAQDSASPQPAPAAFPENIGAEETWPGLDKAPAEPQPAAPKCPPLPPRSMECEHGIDPVYHCAECDGERRVGERRGRDKGCSCARETGSLEPGCMGIEFGHDERTGRDRRSAPQGSAAANTGVASNFSTSDVRAAAEQSQPEGAREWLNRAGWNDGKHDLHRNNEWWIDRMNEHAADVAASRLRALRETAQPFAVCELVGSLDARDCAAMQKTEHWQKNGLGNHLCKGCKLARALKGGE